MLSPLDDMVLESSAGGCQAEQRSEVTIEASERSGLILPLIFAFFDGTSRRWHA